MSLALCGGLAMAILSRAVFAGWPALLPAAAPARGAPKVADDEARAILATLKPPKRQRPLIAIVGINDATEATDYLMPYGILRRADIADVVALATEAGPVRLFNALRVEPRATIAKRAWCNSHRGFESRPVRQSPIRLRLIRSHRRRGRGTWATG